MSPNDHPSHSQYSYEEIKVAVDEADAHGTYVAAHAHGARGIKNALRAGVRSIEHAILIDDEAIQMMLDAEAYLVPTLTAPRQLLKNSANGVGLPANMVAKMNEVIDEHLTNFGSAVRAGVRIAMGSDSGLAEHGLGLSELAAMAEAGMTLEGCLAAATSVAAELMPQHMRIGNLKADYFADLVLVDQDLTSSGQLADLPGRIAGVWKDGCRAV
jgi:imidazolonepropionase-like amidohydrolase